jgi:L-lactate dehydrogenase
MHEIEGVENVTLAMPFLMNGQGIQECLPLELNDEEQEALKRSATVIREAIDSLD